MKEDFIVLVAGQNSHQCFPKVKHSFGLLLLVQRTLIEEK